MLLFLVLWRMTGDLWPSALAAALFAVHPLHVESVAWVAERKDVLSGLFFMLTLAAYTGLCPAPVLAGPLPAGDGPVCPGADGQADAGDAALRVAAVGLLAAGADGRSGERRRRQRRRQQRIGCEPTSPLLAVVEKLPLSAPLGRFLRGDDSGPGNGGHRPATPAAALADCQCPGFLRRLSGPVLLSGGAGRILSPSAKPACRLEDLGALAVLVCVSRRSWLAGGRSPICWSAGSGIWECSCR